MLNKLKKLLFYRQHPETAVRYSPIVKLLKKQRLLKSKILEIGSGSYGIAPYLKLKIDGVDTNFEEPEYELLNQIKGSAVNLPFRNNSYDVAILSDVLEHLPEKLRQGVIKEAIRVSKRLVIISGPCGQKAFEQDKKLAEYSKKKLGKMHHFFEEHLMYGLPEVKDIERYSRGVNKVKSLKVYGNFFNLKAREWLMKYFITNSKLGFYFYLKGLMITVPILTKLNYGDCYRTIVYMTLSKK